MMQGYRRQCGLAEIHEETQLVMTSQRPTHPQTCTHTPMHMCVHTHIHILTNTHTHQCTFVYTQVYTHTYTFSRAHTHNESSVSEYFGRAQRNKVGLLSPLLTESSATPQGLPVLASRLHSLAKPTTARDASHILSYSGGEGGPRDFPM